ncbi:hypothetical protein I552_1861 [Mycobacterium xenopi 3993]|nr:hypothetical protein I552_1861 [Mycobacterium xenopi 3993]
MANYPADDAGDRRLHRPPPMPSANRYLPPLLHRDPETRGGPAPPAARRPVNGLPLRGPRHSAAAKWVRGCIGSCNAPPPRTAPTNPG